jgi:hypothetical protein
MNQVIKRLGLESNVFGSVEGYPHRDYLSATITPTAIEDFAKLLIKECTKVLEIKGAETGQEPYYYGASLIEEHFGIEE